MNISKNNWFARYYNWMYEEYPKDVCSFFWGSLFILSLFFLVIPGKLVKPKYERGGVGSFIWYGFIVWIMYVICVFFGVGANDRLGYEFTNLWGVFLLAPLMGAASLILAFAVLVGVISGGGYLTSRTSRTSLIQNTKDWVGAIRGKYCTKITWK